MQINKLEIRGFGKLSNAALEFTKGLNLIYGCNEAGKTTLQSFIKAMLFGLKGGRAGKDGMPPPLKRYKPWTAKEYGGVLEYSLDNGSTFRVGRNFDINSVRVFDSLFNDITGSFPVSKDRGALFAEKHLGLNEECFEKTVLVRQMETRVDGEQSRELINRLTNTVQTGTEDISFIKAQEALREAIKTRVGNEKTSTRPMDRLIYRLEELKKARAILVEKRNSSYQVEAALREAGIRKESIAGRLACLEAINELLLVRKCTEDMEIELGQVQRLISDRDKRLDEAEERKIAAERLERTLQPLRVFSNLDKGTGDALLELRKDIDSLKRQLDSGGTDRLEVSIRQAKNRVGRISLVAGAGILAAVSLTAVFPGSYPHMPVAILTGAALLAAAAWVRHQAVKGLKSLMEEKKRASVELERVAELVRQKEGILEARLRVVNVQSIEEFFRRKGEYDLAVQQLSGINHEITRLEDELVQQHQRITAACRQLWERLGELGIWGEPDPKGYEESAVKGIRDALQKAGEQLEQRLEQLPALCLEMGYGKERLRSVPVKELLDTVDSDSRKNTEFLNQTNLKVKECETLLITSGSDSEELQKMEEELELLKVRKGELEDTEFSLRTALEVLTEASLEIQRDFLPSLNNRLGSIASRITGSKYNDLRMDDQLRVKIVAPEVGDVMNTLMLSGGTVDQVYLALRLGLAEHLAAITGEKLPLILDEAFAQYDDARMEETLEFFRQTYGDRQLLLFTCKKREVELAKDIYKNALNIIELETGR